MSSNQRSSDMPHSPPTSGSPTEPGTAVSQQGRDLVPALLFFSLLAAIVLGILWMADFFG